MVVRISLFSENEKRPGDEEREPGEIIPSVEAGGFGKAAPKGLE
jgi:hypothetical protein